VHYVIQFYSALIKILSHTVIQVYCTNTDTAYRSQRQKDLPSKTSTGGLQVGKATRMSIKQTAGCRTNRE